MLSFHISLLALQASLSIPRGEGGVKLPNNEAGVYSTTEVNYLGELGVRYPVTDNLSVNLSGWRSNITKRLAR